MGKQNDIFRKGFDEGTKIKLYILKKYLQNWLPVFIERKDTIWKEIFIYDFFAGEGKDNSDSDGSPIITIKELIPYCKSIAIKGIKLRVIFNEYDKNRFDQLSQNLNAAIKECNQTQNCPFQDSGNCAITIQMRNDDFKALFKAKYSEIRKKNSLPRFMFLDQFGIKQITESIFKQIVSLKRTDMVFFISSSFASRFAEQPEFQNYLSLSRQEFDKSKPYHCHRVVFEYYKQLIPKNTEYYLAPFSIKKGSNIYGLIFGSNHTLGIEKFLNICWNINKNTGDANFDIDNERIIPNQPRLFPEYEIPNKLQVFKNKLSERIKNNALTTNVELYRFTFEMGCLPKHANEVIRKMRFNKEIGEFRTCSNNVHKLIAENIK